MKILLPVILLQFLWLTLPAQTYYVQIAGDIDTRVADIAASKLFQQTRLVAYNVVQANGDADMGLMALDYSNSILMSSQFHEGGYKLVSKKIWPSGRLVLAEKINPSNPQDVIPVVIELNPANGSVVNVREMAALPSPYTYTGAFDISYNRGTGVIIILCQATDGVDPCIFEIQYDPSTYQCTFTRYSPQIPFSEIQYLGYIRHNHESADLLGEISFYGTGITGGTRKGFVFYKDFNLPYNFETYCFPDGVLTGFMVNGATQIGADYSVITMAMTRSGVALPAALCIQQKSNGVSTLNWRRFYLPQTGKGIQMGYGRGGHGIKGSGTAGLDYFIGTSDENFLYPRVTLIKYNFINGDLSNCPKFYFANADFKINSPNFWNDGNVPCHFIADCNNPVHGFKIAAATVDEDETDCTDLIGFDEIEGEVTEESPRMDIIDYPGPYNSIPLSLTRTEITATLLPECGRGHRGGELIVSGKIEADDPDLKNDRYFNRKKPF